MSVSTAYPITLMRRAGSALVALLLLAAALPAAALGLDNASRTELSQFTVSESLLTNVLAITRQAIQQGISTNDEFSLSNGTASIGDLVDRVKSNTELMSLIDAHGMTAHQFVLGDLALMQSAMAAQGGGQAHVVEQLLGSANEANVGFYRQHQGQVDSLLSLANGESADASGMQLTEEDKRKLAQLKQMQQSGKFRECLKIGVVMPSATYAYTAAAATSHYNVPNTTLEPGTLAKSGKILEDLSANVPEEVPSDALMKMGRQMALQEGHDPIELTAEFKAAMTTLKDWLQANCEPDKTAGDVGASSASTATAGPASAPNTVKPASSDAPGVQFGQLAANDALILQNADGIQTGDGAGPAHLTVIFDPNGPYAAKLYTLLQKKYPDVPVRWVPVAYMTKTSAPLTALLIHSRSPRQDLNTDLADYNFQNHHGGIVPGADRSSELPGEQQQLFEALKTWGGYTPMIVFEDQAGRWLQTGGSGEEVIHSVLAQAAD
ncbi:hypothetical protein [Marinobacter sp. C2H3]|uniref:hypothetical protein n=1 Tax=Marinobacter sp. C2H3 TaxID=3119003 RepID=UPI00300F4D84